ncbi:DUF1120 domain-containing protein [Pseudomonas sp. MAFF 301380]|uniref:DUF1120 domain-containing protein n=1 Tax=Pseudomonas lactucae TaxID=2813360 RepID=A0A9X1C5J7_9PSED|nr:DUF1120 domain-containing protein [Pseudomonas lactucae]MBN2985076.1 DUF1120 domain-containing protein [Pseudomonas lactucae]
MPLVAAAWLTSTLPALAASSVDLSVTGLITPSACHPTLSDGGVYDLGKIAARDLNVDRPTRLTEHSLQLVITCEATTLLAIQPKDNRLGSSSAQVNPHIFGLGLVNATQPLGYMELRLMSIMGDGVRMYGISTGGANWFPTSILSPNLLTSFTNRLFLGPEPLRYLNADLLISPIIAPANTLPLAEEMPIDGSVTLSMHYL